LGENVRWGKCGLSIVITAVLFGIAVQRLKRVRETLRTSQNPSAFFAGVGLWRDVLGWMRKQWKLSIIKSKHVIS
jgi:hypothetical protein